MSQVLSFTPKTKKLIEWPVLILCCKLLQKTVAQCHFKISYCLLVPFLFCTSYNQTGICETFVLAGHRNPTLRFPLRHQHLSETGLIIRRKRDWSLCSLIYNGLTPKALLSRNDDDHFRFTRTAFALYTAVGRSVAYDLVVADCVLCVMIWGQMPALSL